MTNAELPEPIGRVLVVDDHAELRHMFGLALQIAGFDVLEADSPVEAHRRVTLNRPDALVVDLQEAVSTGLDLLCSLRSRPELDRTPIVFLANEQADDIRWQALKAGADWFALKPLSLRQLQDRVGDLMRKGRPRLRPVAGRELQRRRLAG